MWSARGAERRGEERQGADRQRTVARQKPAKTGAAARHSDGKRRCAWCPTDPLYVAYHDDEWGIPVRDDRRLFEMLCLEVVIGGLELADHSAKSGPGTGLPLTISMRSKWPALCRINPYVISISLVLPDQPAGQAVTPVIPLLKLLLQKLQITSKKLSTK